MMEGEMSLSDDGDARYAQIHAKLTLLGYASLFVVGFSLSSHSLLLVAFRRRQRLPWVRKDLIWNYWSGFNELLGESLAAGDDFFRNHLVALLAESQQHLEGSDFANQLTAYLRGFDGEYLLDEEQALESPEGRHYLLDFLASNVQMNRMSSTIARSKVASDPLAEAVANLCTETGFQPAKSCVRFSRAHFDPKSLLSHWFFSLSFIRCLSWSSCDAIVAEYRRDSASKSNISITRFLSNVICSITSCSRAQHVSESSLWATKSCNFATIRCFYNLFSMGLSKCRSISVNHARLLSSCRD